MAYSLVDGVKRFNRDPDIEMFGMILDGDVTEEVYIDQLNLVERVSYALMEADRSENGGNLIQGSLSKTVFQKTVSRILSWKSQDQLKSLIEAVQLPHPSGVPFTATDDTASGGGHVEYPKLFEVRFYAQSHVNLSLTTIFAGRPKSQ